MSVKVSKSAYRDLVMLQKFIVAAETEFVKFPETASKWASINELLKKSVIKKEGERKGALYGLAIPLDEVLESTRKTKDLTAKKNPIQISENSAITLNPVSRGGYKPGFFILKKFVENIEETSRNLGMSKTDDIEKRISDMSIALAKTKNREERSLLIRSLGQANNELHHLGVSVLVEAIKDVAAAAEFRAFNLDDLISVEQEDYQG